MRQIEITDLLRLLAAYYNAAEGKTTLTDEEIDSAKRMLGLEK